MAKKLRGENASNKQSRPSSTIYLTVLVVVLIVAVVFIMVSAPPEISVSGKAIYVPQNYEEAQAAADEIDQGVIETTSLMDSMATST